jgi:hypothetical protein
MKSDTLAVLIHARGSVDLWAFIVFVATSLVAVLALVGRVTTPEAGMRSVRHADTVSNPSKVDSRKLE